MSKVTLHFVWGHLSRKQTVKRHFGIQLACILFIQTMVELKILLVACTQYMSEQRVTHRNRRRLVWLRMFECPQKKKDKRNSNNPIILESAVMALRSSKGSCPKSHKWLERFGLFGTFILQLWNSLISRIIS